MRILHVATNDIMGGAARAAYRIHAGLQRLGHESLMYVQYRGSDDPSVIPFKPSMRFLTSAARRLQTRVIEKDAARYEKSRPQGYDLFTDDRAPFGSDWFRQLPRADLIHLHWVGGFVDQRRFFSQLSPDVPVVWRLADMNPFTGGCHFDHGCGRFQTECGRCPQLGSTDPHDLSHRVWRRKQTAFAGLSATRLHIVVLNQSMVETIKRTPLLGRFSVSVIPNGLDTEVFAPRDRRAAREMLGVPTNARVLLFAADQMQNRRKGLSFVIDALAQFREVPDLFLLSIGRGNPGLPAGIGHRHLGLIQDDLLLSLVYSAADVFVFPSLQETFGQTALEAMACGTPVVGFNGVGGIPDLVKDGVTGRKVPIRDVQALGGAIRELLEASSERAEISANCRRLVVEQFNLQMQARRYLDLYSRVLENKNG